MARRLGSGLARIPGVRLARPVEANAVFVHLPDPVREALAERYSFYPWNPPSGEWRLMCSWATPPEAVDELIDRAVAAAGGLSFEAEPGPG